MFEQLQKLEARYNELEQLLVSPEVIPDRERSNKLAKELSALKEPVSLFREYKKLCNEFAELEAVLKEKHDKEFVELAKKELQDLDLKKEELEDRLKTALEGEDEDAGRDIIVEIRQGTGGDEAGLFAADLYRMYTMYAAKKGWRVEPMSAATNEAGGYKEVSFSVKGKDACKRLKFESGVHRVQRVPATEAQGRIHTSTASVAVLIEPEEVDLVIEPKDLRIDTYRSSGPGGQHMQKTDSAVRITHIPTGLVVACQDERSQLKNRQKAMAVLRARLRDMEIRKQEEATTKDRQSQVGSGERAEKIRTYNFPQDRLTDHRIGLTLHNLPKIMAGELDAMIDTLATTEQAKQLQGQLA